MGDILDDLGLDDFELRRGEEYHTSVELDVMAKIGEVNGEWNDRAIERYTPLIYDDVQCKMG